MPLHRRTPESLRRSAQRLGQRVPLQLPLGVWIIVSTALLLIVTWVVYVTYSDVQRTNANVQQGHSDRVATQQFQQDEISQNRAQIAQLVCLVAPGSVPGIDALRVQYQCPPYGTAISGVQPSPNAVQPSATHGARTPTPSAPSPVATTPSPIATPAAPPSVAPPGLTCKLLGLGC